MRKIVMQECLRSANGGDASWLYFHLADFRFFITAGWGVLFIRNVNKGIQTARFYLHFLYLVLVMVSG